MYCLANDSCDRYVYGQSKKVKDYIEWNPNTNWNLQFFPKENLLLEAVEKLIKEEGKTVINLKD